MLPSAKTMSLFNLRLGLRLLALKFRTRLRPGRLLRLLFKDSMTSSGKVSRVFFLADEDRVEEGVFLSVTGSSDVDGVLGALVLGAFVVLGNFSFSCSSVGRLLRFFFFSSLDLRFFLSSLEVRFFFFLVSCSITSGGTGNDLRCCCCSTSSMYSRTSSGKSHPMMEDRDSPPREFMEGERGPKEEEKLPRDRDEKGDRKEEEEDRLL